MREINGEGDAAYLLYPRPRDFTTGQFRLISTWDGVPTDEDVFRTISRGMPGSAMPSWAHLPEETRWGLVHYVKSFSTRPFTIRPNHEADNWGNGGAGVITASGHSVTPPTAEWYTAYHQFYRMRIDTRYLHPMESIAQFDNEQGDGFALATLFCPLAEFLEACERGHNFDVGCDPAKTPITFTTPGKRRTTSSVFSGIRPLTCLCRCKGWWTVSIVTSDAAYCTKPGRKVAGSCQAT